MPRLTRSPKPAFPASGRADPERLEETINHLFVTYTPLPVVTRLPLSQWRISTLRLQITKTEKGRIGQSLCFSWVIYLFMDALYNHFKWAGIIREAQRGTPLSLRAEGFPCTVGTDHWEDDHNTGEANEDWRRNCAFTNKCLPACGS